MITDPLEMMIAVALAQAGVAYVSEKDDRKATLDLDFRIGDVFIECKAYATDRTEEQLSRADNIILIQGRQAVELFCRLITRG